MWSSRSCKPRGPKEEVLKDEGKQKRETPARRCRRGLLTSTAGCYGGHLGAQAWLVTMVETGLSLCLAPSNDDYMLLDQN